ncbi:MAG: thiol:disulfide interchange protein DsbA [Cellvibrionaceae bacterium]|jgi:thiol:disulfide interchange protein DsbA
MSLSTRSKWLTITTFLLLAIALAALLPKYQAQANEPFVEGEHYQIIKDPVRTARPGEIEVTEVFWYGCGHCNSFRPVFEQWEKDLPEGVYTRHSPAVWRKNMETHAAVFYAAEALGIQKKIHKNMFDAMHIRKQRLEKTSEIYPLFREQGISEKDFYNAFNSFGVKSKVQQAISRARGYGISGTPEIIVNGKYRISSSMAGSHGQMLKVAEHLIAKEKATKTTTEEIEQS